MDDKDPYLGIDEAEIFFSRRLKSSAWEGATDPERLKALKEATDRIDNLNYIGNRLSETQDLEFPRDYQTEVPNEIKKACCLIAYALLDGVDPQIEDENLGVVTQAFSTARTTYEPTVRREYVRNGIPSAEAWQLLLPFLADPREITIRRVS